MMDGNIPRLQFQINGVGIVNLVRVNPDTEDVFVLIEIDHLAALEQALGVRPRQDSHTAIGHCRGRASYPQRSDFHRLQGPVRAVLMPLHGLAGTGFFGDIMRRKHGHIRPEELRRNIDQSVVSD